MHSIFQTLLQANFYHNQILQKLNPTFVHVLINGKIVKTGDASLVKEIEEKGYDAYKELA